MFQNFCDFTFFKTGKRIGEKCWRFFAGWRM